MQLFTLCAALAGVARGGIGGAQGSPRVGVWLWRQGPGGLGELLPQPGVGLVAVKAGVPDHGQHERTHRQGHLQHREAQPRPQGPGDPLGDDQRLIA